MVASPPGSVLVSSAGDGDAPVQVAGLPGRYRPLATSPRLLILRRDGGGPGQRPAADDDHILMAGEVFTHDTVLEVINLLATARWAGVLEVHGRTSHRRLGLDRGSLRFARSDDPRDRLNKTLFRMGVLSPAEAEDAERGAPSGRRFGERLIARDLVDETTLFRALERQAEEIFLAAVLEGQGSYTFSVRDLWTADAPFTTRLPLQKLVFDAALRVDRFRQLRELVPDERLRPVARAGVEVTDLGSHSRRIFGLCDGSRDLESLARESWLGRFGVLEVVHDLCRRGCVDLREPEAQIDAASDGERTGPAEVTPERGGADEPLPGPVREALDRLHLFEQALGTLQAGITITDAGGRIVYANEAEARLHGYEVDELVGRPASILAPPELARPLTRSDLDAVGTWKRETLNVRKDGATFPVQLLSDVVRDAQGRPVGLVTVCQDASEGWAKDPLTGLENRGLLEDRLRRALARSRRHGGLRVALLFIDLDRFKEVNDCLGHLAGDRLLAAVAQRLDARTREDEALARIGGDEFVLLVEGARSAGQLQAIADRFHEALDRPFRIDGHELSVTASIGVATGTGRGTTAEDLLRDADTAMYRAKAGGRARTRFAAGGGRRSAEETRPGMDPEPMLDDTQPVTSPER